MRFSPLKVGGISCWALAVISVFILPAYTLLLLAAAVAIAWIVPGYLLQTKYKQQNS
jgi:Flp pilus assembly protein TadB